MKRVLTALVLIPIVLLVVFKAPVWLLTFVVGIFALLAAYEYLEILKNLDITPFRNVTLVAAAIPFLLIAFPALTPRDFLWASGLRDWLIVIYPCVLLVLALREPDLRKGFLGTGPSAMVFPYIVLPFLALIFLRQYLGPNGIVFLFVVVWAGDIFAYYIGRAIGKHKLAPRISPGKSWEGAIASFISSIALGLAFFVLARPDNPTLQLSGLALRTFWHASLVNISFLCALLNVAAQLGDLAESAIKRAAGVKDSGTMLPGHGGMLDRVDALLFASPVMWAYAMIMGISSWI
jgi:phosphatidate cytidylyltransferase